VAFERVAALSDLAVGTAAQVHAGGEPICLVRTGATTVRAVHDTCSHQDWPLHEGWVDGDAIECALHGSSFDLVTGRPDSLPAVRPVPTYAVRLDGDDVLVDASAPTNAAPVPQH
jgi:3-phenylpropionate/trans-cinnamate dioxygenase ferredoxin component